jgi:class 3 adenylate cyclase/HAMP domain-containing protein
MKIAPKIVLLFLPLLVGPLVFVVLSASVSARNGITNVATELLLFKGEELVRYASSQYQLLEENDLLTTPEFVSASKESIASFARGLVRHDSELVFAADREGGIAFSTGPVELSEREREQITTLVADGASGWMPMSIGGTERVSYLFPYSPMGWSFFVTDEASTFYGPIEEIFRRSGVTLAITLVLTSALVVVFSSYITHSLKQIVNAMHDIVATGELSRRVEVRFADETGELATSFNSMSSALQHAYEEIKAYALQAAVAERREKKIRNVFQKFVPNHVIEQFFASPESMLVGQERKLAVLFSDIRGFTTLSEGLTPSSLVESLNRYFSRMVETVIEQQGVVDKYIGDAIMAFFGAPAPDKKSCFHAVSAALKMLDELDEFNEHQRANQRPTFQIGLGVNYGDVTIGNIGSEKKMEYTVIGDEVNLASRLEGLTKAYGERIIISDPVYRELGGAFPCRMIDRVVVKGKTRPVAIYGVRRYLSATEERAWKYHHTGLDLYYRRDFTAAQAQFQAALELLPTDAVDQILLERTEELSRTGAPEHWNGVMALSEK